MTAQPLSPELLAALRRMLPREARTRYFMTSDGAMCSWSTERLGDGKYHSALYIPVGKGARSGRRAVTRWEVRREVAHTTRRAAKARALRLYLERQKEHSRP